MRYMQSFPTSGAEQEAISQNLLGRPYVAVILDENRIDWGAPTPPEPVYSAMPLTMEVLGDGDLLWQVTKNDGSFQPRVIEYSKNGGEWTSITAGTSTSVSIPVLTGDIIQFRGNNTTYAINGQNLHTLKIRYQTPFNIYGNINSLISADNFTGITSFGTDYTFYGFFANSGVRDASNLVMATTGLTNYCYGNMFISAPNLINAPELPAITLKMGCYQNMFKNDSSLVSIKCLAISISASYCTTDWVSGVSSTGTFVKNPSMNDWTSGTSGIPAGWTVEDAVL